MSKANSTIINDHDKTEKVFQDIEIQPMEMDSSTLKESEIEIRLAMTAEERIESHEHALQLFNDMTNAGIEFYKNKVS